MSVIYFNLVPPKLMEDTQTSQFVVSNPQASTVKVILDSCIVTNTGSASATFNINLVPNTESAQASNLLIKGKRLDPGESYMCPEILGQVLEENGSLSTLASLANTLTLSVSGREITA